ncbi:ABC transporter substrate-binding protein [Coriobacteriia bacterium Es71-Z0120]|uniref:substrate-binding periplasmic protein n=1 Tax=Parvivirga hydrogeniphila TaxID=2939460 RepID=UPI002260DD9A|nr:ABC transporter substrate-binding protein [Parvivirga hydrogeniphila]MCL4078007.1 ABC transporter substrate-binding protein [Parvivirga hydrogeniphila]
MARRLRIVTASTLALLLIATLALGGCTTTAEQGGATIGDEEAAKDASLQTVKERGEIIVGLAPFYAPFESTNEQTKEIEGFDIDLMNAIVEKMGVKATYRPAEWQALLGGLEKGDYDVIFSAMSKKEAAEANVEFSDVYYLLPDVIIVAKGNPKGITSKDDLKDKIVGVQLGSGSEQLADELNPEIGFKGLKKYKLTQDAMNDLKAGRIDAVIAGYTFALEQAKVDPSFEVSSEPLESAELVGVFRKGSTSLVEAFNKALAEVKADGTYDALVKKWLTIQQQ